MAAASAWFNRQPIVCKTTALSVCSVADSFIASSLPYPAPQGEPPCRRIAREALPVAPVAPVAPTKGTTVPPVAPTKGTTVPPVAPDSATALPHRCRHTSAARGAPRPSKGGGGESCSKRNGRAPRVPQRRRGYQRTGVSAGSISGLHGNRLPDEPTRRFPQGRCKTRPATAREAPSASVFPSENGWMNSSS